jgi:hypothetical protein
MEQGPGEESFPHLIPQPDEVPGVVPIGRGGGLHLERHDSVSGELGEQVQFAAPVLLAHVVQAGTCRAQRRFWSQLGDNEGVE